MKTRRTFIKHAGLATAGSLLIPACAPSSKDSGSTESAAAAEPPVLKPKWDVGIQLYTLRNQIAEDLPGTISKVAEIGYEHVELFAYGDRKYFGMPAADFYSMLKDNGLGISSSHHVTGNVNVEGQGTLTNGWEMAVEDALLAGQSHMVCPYLYEEERQSIDDYKRLAELLNKSAEVCKSAEMEFCYHNHDFEFIALDGEMPIEVLLSETDENLVKMELDIYWITKAGGNALDFFDKYPGRTSLWHVKDLGEDGATLPVGTGTIDYSPIFDAAGKSGLAKFFVEQDNSDDPFADIATSFKNVSEVLAG